MYYRAFKMGAYQLDAFELAADEEVEIDVEWDWSDLEVTNDWSVTIWGALGEVSIRHSNSNYVSDELPVIGAEPSSVDTNTETEIVAEPSNDDTNTETEIVAEPTNDDTNTDSQIADNDTRTRTRKRRHNN